MYKIIKDGTAIGTTDQPHTVKMQPNGCYGAFPIEEADGVVWGGVVYHLFGREEIEGAETVLLVNFDSGPEITKVTDTAGIVFVTLSESGSIDPVTAGEHIDLFSTWAVPVSYAEGQIRSYAGKLYKCISAHTSQSDWMPDASASLWVSISDPAEEWPAWSQPIGAHDAYNSGAKVSHKEKHWSSTTDANVWEPGVYGWAEVAE